MAKLEEMRIPRRGDRVRFWETTPAGNRQQVTASVVRRSKRNVYVHIDGRDGMQMTPTRLMEILPK